MEDHKYTCKRCGYGTYQKSNFRAHLNRVTICTPTQQDVSREELLREFDNPPSSLECEYCKKILCNRFSKYRHKQTCKKKNDIIALQERIKVLEAKIKATAIAEKKTLNTFGYENIDYVDDEVFKDCFKGQTILPLLEFLHFHPCHPENHNIRIRNIHKKILEYFEEGRWITEDKDTILDDVIRVCYRRLCTYFVKHQDTIYNEIREENNGYNAKRSIQCLTLWLERLESDNVDLFAKMRPLVLEKIIKNKTIAKAVQWPKPS